MSTTFPQPSKTIDQSKQPDECISCSHKSCRNTEPGTLDICDYGIAHFNDGGQIKKKKESVTMRHIAANLRHELDKVLQFIINEAVEIDGALSLKAIDTANPASRIVGATVILDNFIEMVSGVYDFTPNRDRSTGLTSSPVGLDATVRRYLDTYSLIKNTRRANALQFEIAIEPSVLITRLTPVVEYMVAILTDNIWKYSREGTTVRIASDFVDDAMLNLDFENEGEPIPDGDDIFNKGYQLHPQSEGFGFGLYWATILCDHYNALTERTESSMVQLTHTQSITAPGVAKHAFRISNLSYEVIE